jgi:hypothetical protein
MQRLAVRNQANGTWVNLLLDAGNVGGNLNAGDTLEATGPNAFAVVTGGTVHRAGDTMTGGLRITKPYAAVGDEALTLAPSAGNAFIVLTRAAGVGAGIQGRTGANMRWQIQLGNATAESGANVGSDFIVHRYNDVGALLDAPLTIARSTGGATFSSSVTANSTVQARAVGAASSVLQCMDNTGAVKSQFYWNASTGHTFVTNVAGGNNLALAPSGDVAVAPAAGHNFLCNPGVGWQTGGGPWTALSDARIKTVEAEYSQGLEAVLALRPVVYRYKGNDSLNPPEPSLHAWALEKSFIGLVAQEAEIPMPEMVGQHDGFIDGEAVSDLRTLNNGPLVYALVNAVKELNAKIVTLEAQLAAKT